MPDLNFDNLCYGFPFGKVIAISDPVNENVSKITSVETNAIVKKFYDYYKIPYHSQLDEFNKRAKRMFGFGEFSLYRID